MAREWDVARVRCAQSREEQHTRGSHEVTVVDSARRSAMGLSRRDTSSRTRVERSNCEQAAEAERRSAPTTIALPHKGRAAIERRALLTCMLPAPTRQTTPASCVDGCSSSSRAAFKPARFSPLAPPS